MNVKISAATCSAINISGDTISRLADLLNWTNYCFALVSAVFAMKQTPVQQKKKITFCHFILKTLGLAGILFLW